MKWMFARAVTVTSLFVFGCSGAASSTGITSADLSCTTDSGITYANTVQQLVSDNCLSCHGGRESPSLTTQAALVANKDRVLQQAVYSTAMPQSGDMAQTDRIKLGQWLSCGAP